MAESSNSQTISIREIDPNLIHKHLKTPLPGFAIAALVENGFTYDNIRSSAGISEYDLQRESNKCKLAEHIQYVESYIDKDGPRLWASSTSSNDGDKCSSESSK